MLHLTTAEQDVYLNLVVMLEEFLGLLDLGIDIVIAGLGANSDFFEFLLVCFLMAFLGLGVFELPIVHDFAHGRSLFVGHLNQIESCFASHFERLRSRDDAVLLALSSNKSDWGNPDLLVHPGTGWAPRRGIAVVRRDCRFSFLFVKTG